jgi:hypothetical protein
MRLIDADKLMEHLTRCIDAEKGLFRAVCVAIKCFVEQMPTVDAVEVVRCKDCKWYKEGELLAPNKFCFRLMHPTENRHVGYNFSDNDFCSYGERKDNGAVRQMENV